MANKPNLFDEIVAKLRAATEMLQRVVEQMKSTAALQAENTAKLRAINEKMRSALPNLRQQNEALESAGRHLDQASAAQASTNAKLQAAPPLRPAAVPPADPPRPTARKIDVFPMPPPKRGSPAN